ncbi:MAG: ABC transporter substrate-binding protein [Acidisphaera sp.]|nr:ABC transporter substrate-binding protein [Acidisphaera sp.]
MTEPRRFPRRAVLGAAAATLAAPAIVGAKPASIVVASSGGKLEEAFTAAYYKPFTAKTGIQIITAVNTYSKLKATVDAGAVEWDVAQMDAAAAANSAKLGLLEKLDYAVIDRTDLVEGVPHEEYIPCDVAAAVMSWNTRNVAPAAAPQSWAELWDTKRFGGQRGFWKQPFQTMEIALMADGVAKDQLYPIDVERALRSLERIKPQIFWWTSGGQSAQILIDGDIAAGMSWNGRVFDPKQGGAPVDFSFNQALFVADAWVIPRGTKNRQAAMDFIAFTLQSGPQAEFAKAIPYGPVNRKALPLIDKPRLAFLPSSDENLPKGVLQNFDWWAQNGQKTGERFNSWMLG